MKKKLYLLSIEDDLPSLIKGKIYSGQMHTNPEFYTNVNYEDRPLTLPGSLRKSRFLEIPYTRLIRLLFE